MIEPNWLGGMAGGILIGLSAVLLLAGAGRIAGISGIVGGLLNWKKDSTDYFWRAAFIVGLLTGAGFFAFFGPGIAIHLQTGPLGLVIAGLLVGVGVRLGSGCTSGHGVCGLARRSSRSLTATLTFMGMAMITVFITRHVLS